MVSEKTLDQADGQLCSYELVYIISPEVDEERCESTVESVSRFITDKGGAVSETERWGKKRLAYPIKQFREGTYVLTRFQMQPAYNKELETNLKISEDVIRHLLIKLN